VFLPHSQQHEPAVAPARQVNLTLSGVTDFQSHPPIGRTLDHTCLSVTIFHQTARRPATLENCRTLESTTQLRPTESTGFEAISEDDNHDSVMVQLKQASRTAGHPWRDGPPAESDCSSHLPRTLNCLLRPAMTVGLTPVGCLRICSAPSTRFRSSPDISSAQIQAQARSGAA
jgi:hypothetical protein